MKDPAALMDQAMSKPAPLQIATPARIACTSILWRQGAASWATIVAKATFKLVHGGDAERIEPLDVVTTDRYRTTGSLEFASETAPYLPEVGVLVSGHAYAPAGRPVTSASVRIGLVRGTGRPLIDKMLHVFGDRAPAGEREARPFAKMPLVYERACGGPDNPVGVPPGARPSRT